jgi:hypothetical protein
LSLKVFLLLFKSELSTYFLPVVFGTLFFYYLDLELIPIEKVDDKKINDFKKAGHVKATNFKGYINSQAYLLWLVKIAHDLLLEL